MSVPTFALAIPTCAGWRPERKASLDRLCEALGVYAEGLDKRTSPFVKAAKIFGEKKTNAEWSHDMWTWGAAQKTTHFITCQDDVIPSPDFFPALQAMVSARPHDIIALEVVHDAAPGLATAGHRWMSTSDCVIGVAYVLPVELLKEFLTWRATKLKDGVLDAVDEHGRPVLTEDTMLALWCLSTGRRVYHPLPTIIDHDLNLASTYGNDSHGHRRPHVRWDWPRRTWTDNQLDDPDFWLGGAPPRFAGRFYDHSPAMAERFVEDWGPTQRARVAHDEIEAQSVLRRLALETRLARVDDPNRPKLYVCTPTSGKPAPEYRSTVARLVALEAVDVRLAFEVSTWRQENHDLVTTRSRFVRDFLETDCTHLLFVDDDESFGAETILGMLATGHPAIAAPAPRRQGVNWDAVMNDDGRPPEARAYRYPIRWLDGEPKQVQADGCIEVAGLGLGCALLSRRMLERMIQHYGAERFCLTEDEIDDVIAACAESNNGDAYEREISMLVREVRGHRRGTENLTVEDNGRPLVELFGLLREPMTTPDGSTVRAHLSEDMSFWKRWRDCGGSVQMYLGEGSPVNHHGPHRYAGHIEAFGLRRAS